MYMFFILISDLIASQSLNTLYASNTFIFKSKLYDNQVPLIAAMQNIEWSACEKRKMKLSTKYLSHFTGFDDRILNPHSGYLRWIYSMKK